MNAIEKTKTLINEGKLFVSANKASEILGCSGAALILAAKRKQLGNLPHYFSGRNLHLSTIGILNLLEGKNP